MNIWNMQSHPWMFWFWTKKKLCMENSCWARKNLSLKNRDHHLTRGLTNRWYLHLVCLPDVQRIVELNSLPQPSPSGTNDSIINGSKYSDSHQAFHARFASQRSSASQPSQLPPKGASPTINSFTRLDIIKTDISPIKFNGGPTFGGREVSLAMSKYGTFQ